MTSSAPTALKNVLNSTGSFTGRFLMLPNGQALFDPGGSQLWVYTGSGSVNSSSTPSISGISNNGGNSYTLTGSALNGASQGATYGDDAEMDSNYPIVSVATNIGTTYYARTTNWNATGVGVTNGSTSTNFSLPSTISSPPVVTVTAPAGTEGQLLNNVAVATFTDPNGSFTGQYAATVDWGDGTQSAGTISGPVKGVYTVSGTHTYTEEGSYTLAATVVDNYASGNLSVSGSGVSSTAVAFTLSATANAPVTVTDPPVIGTGGFIITATAGTSTGDQTLATFTDPGGNEPLSDYSATIAWGDGGTTSGTISGPVSGVYTITGAYTYSTAGTFTISVTISHDSATPTVVTDTANVSSSASSVTNVNSITSNGTYGVGSTIFIQVTFNATETVTGTPQLALNSGGTANYSSGSGTSTLTFAYVVGAGDASSHLDYSSTSALSLNGGTITGPGAVPALLTLAAPGTAGSLGANSSIVIDTVAPKVLSYSVLFGTKGLSYNVIGSSRFDLPWTITGIQVVFSKPIASADTSSLSGLTTTGMTGLGTNTLTWNITSLTIGKFVTSLLGTGADAIKDAAGNELYAGAGFAQNFNVLYGDFDGDGVVTTSDMRGILGVIGGTYNILADLNGDGIVSIQDMSIVQQRIGTKL